MEKNAKLLLTEKEAAELLSMSTHFLRRDRITPTGVGIPFIRIGGAVRYQRNALEDWTKRCVEKAEGVPPANANGTPQKKRGRGRPMKREPLRDRKLG